MTVPDRFSHAYSGLEALIEVLSTGTTARDDIGREAGRWMREDAGGSLTLCKAAVFAMRHEAGVRGAEGNGGRAKATLRALELVDRAVDPLEDAASPPKMPRPAPVPDALKKRAPGVRGFRLGRVEILAEPKPEGWRLSVSHPDRFPSVEELMLARGVTRDVDKTFAAIIPAASAPPDGRGYVVDLVEAGVRRIGGTAG